jgi:hypothetical protein
MTAHKLSKLAHDQCERVDMEDEECKALRNISALTRVSNDNSVIGINLLKANKEAFGQDAEESYEQRLARVRRHAV